MASFTLHIQYVDRPPETRTFADRDKVTLGRDIGDIALRDSQVSGRHGEITFVGGTLRYTDLGSTNGSFLLDGRRVSTIEMTPGMAVRLGNSLITVHMIDSPMAGKGRTMIAGGGFAPFSPPPPGGMPPPGGLGMPPPGGGMPPPGGMPMPGGTLAPTAQAPGDLAYAPTSAMPAAMPSGFAQPVAQPPGAPPPGFPPPPTPVAPMPSSDDFDGAPTNPGGAGVPTPAPGQAMPMAVGGEDFAAIFKQAWDFLRPVLVPASLVLGAVTVPIAVVSWVFGLIPVIGGIFGALLALAQFVLMPLGIAALTRFLLGRYLNNPVDWMTAWKQQIANARMIWPNFFVAGLIAAIGTVFLIIPGLLLGAFIGPIYFCEGKRMVDINLRNLDIAKLDPITVIIVFIAVAVAAGVGIAIPSLVFGLIPVLGSLLVAILGAAAMAVITPYVLTLSILLYFRIRRRTEGGEPEIQAMQMLIATSAALPQGSGQA
ncbi:MAG: FHA domain-containing protein [Myxococcales bacterium]|nr:FHA domain-containing protein [Myxococcales bacterium]